MKNVILTALVVLLICSQGHVGWAQESNKFKRYFSKPILTDSASTLMIPTTYGMEFFSSNKSLSWGNYYANLIVYNFKTDTYFRMFDEDVFIEAFNPDPNLAHANPGGSRVKNFSGEWVFYIVKSTDYNGNGKVDEKDPNILFVSNRKGEGLRSLSPGYENVISIVVYEKQGFALVELQRDANQDKDFKPEDKDFYMARIDLSTLQWGNKIEISDREMN